jgi:hypothetical protein
MRTIPVTSSESTPTLLEMIMRIAPAFVALGMFLAISAEAPAEAKDLLPLAHGTYVREDFDAADAPFAAILEYDGSAFSGPHSSACVSKVLDHDGAKYRVSTTCSAAGDGSPAAPYTEKERIVVQSPTRMQFTHGDDMAIYRLVKAS